ncbi:uncharacterized protein Z519_08128 [Cladophialophora bantiana CBS 173.52]|uniref:Ankyrin repeat protein n=1 Tax=Cladophialophora bantiana (strain ATCC 10958 / CBS 173.52 / CDC B-1940 / NIH 8579) TaxID=1442370 RepID=A0A0D2FXL8_CLAB1|nr:uncharacterized protein Z519_08128 [Cladophialophora bantiana CBS 173.52]KIW91232.1 hypothetical protein Z519_08128 [Cladophialophora bantiana CBS 173.52]
MAQSLPPEPKILSPHQEAMIQASTSTLFAAAISHGQQSTVRYLHSVYPKFDFYDASIINSFTATPDLEMLKLIYSYSPRIVRYECGDHITTFLSMACEGGPQNAPVVGFLLDHGAMPDDDFGSYAYQFGVELLPAVRHDQPIEIIEKMIPKASRLWLPIDVAIRRKRVDALELLLNEEEKRSKPSPDGKYEQSLLRRAQDTEDKKVIAMVERYILNMEEQAKRSTAKGLQSTRVSTESRKWWQFGAKADSKSKADARDSSSAPRTDAEK